MNKKRNIPASRKIHAEAGRAMFFWRGRVKLAASGGGEADEVL